MISWNNWKSSFSEETCLLLRVAFIIHSLWILTAMNYYTTVRETGFFSSISGLISPQSAVRSTSGVCNCITVSSVDLCFDRSAVSATQAGWWLVSLSSCRHPLLLWHLIGWAPPASPSGRCVVLHHHQCRSPLGSLTHLKFKINLFSLSFQCIIYN